MVECNIMVRKILGNVPFICNFENCSLKGEKSICYDELVGRHMDECQSNHMTCPLKCDDSLQFTSKIDAL